MDKPPRYDHYIDKYKLPSILPSIQRNTNEISKTKDDKEDKQIDFSLWKKEQHRYKNKSLERRSQFELD